MRGIVVILWLCSASSNVLVAAFTTTPIAQPVECDSGSTATSEQVDVFKENGKVELRNINQNVSQDAVHLKCRYKDMAHQTAHPSRTSLFTSAIVKRWYPWTFYIICCLASVGVVGNLVTVVAVCRYGRVKRPAYYLVCNLVVSDLLACVLLGIMTYYQYMRQGIMAVRGHKYPCLLTFCTCNLSVYSSLGSISLVSAERLFSVTMPIRHKTLVNQNRTLVAVLVMWATILLLTTPPLLGGNTWQPDAPCMTLFIYNNTYFYLAIIIVPMVTLFFVMVTNIVIARIAFKKRNKVLPRPSQITMVSSATRTSVAYAGSVTTFPNQEVLTTQKRDRIQYRITQMMLMVVGVFCITCVPYIIMVILLKTYINTKSLPPDFVLIIFDMSKVLLAAGIVVNPFIYAYRGKMFRQAYKQLFLC